MIEALVLVAVLVLVWCLPDSGDGLPTPAAALKAVIIGILALLVILVVLGHVPGVR